MRIRTDDEVYRVDAVWLGPPKATFPWRARYVAWGVGIVVFLLVLTVLRNLGLALGWSLAWGLVVTVGITRLITAKISHERPLGAVLAMGFRELTTPRERIAGAGGAVTASNIRVHTQRPRPRNKRTLMEPTPFGEHQHGQTQGTPRTRQHPGAALAGRQ